MGVDQSHHLSVKPLFLKLIKMIGEKASRIEGVEFFRWSVGH